MAAHTSSANVGKWLVFLMCAVVMTRRRPNTSSIAASNATSLAVLAGFGAPPLVRSASSGPMRAFTAVFRSIVLQKSDGSGPRIVARSSCSTGLCTAR